MDPQAVMCALDVGEMVSHAVGASDFGVWGLVQRDALSSQHIAEDFVCEHAVGAGAVGVEVWHVDTAEPQDHPIF